jgi:hypothetical protein
MRQATPNAVCSIVNPVVQSVGSRASQRQDLAWPIALIDEPRINDRHRSVAAIGSVKLSNGGGRIMANWIDLGSDKLRNWHFIWYCGSCSLIPAVGLCSLAW